MNAAHLGVIVAFAANRRFLGCAGLHIASSPVLRSTRIERGPDRKTKRLRVLGSAEQFALYHKARLVAIVAEGSDLASALADRFRAAGIYVLEVRQQDISRMLGTWNTVTAVCREIARRKPLVGKLLERRRGTIDTSGET